MEVTGICVKLVSGKIPGLKFWKTIRKETIMEVIYVVVGILIGFAVSSIIRRKHPVGFLRIDKSDPDGPYLFLELKKSVNEIVIQRTVLLEVKREDFIPHK